MRKKFGLRRSVAALVFTLVGALLIYDSSYHFDSERVQLKRKHHSAQRNWSVHYSQRNLFNDSSFRYQADFRQLAEVIKPQSLVLSDLATSYYAASMLPVYVLNVHQHQGRSRRPEWARFLDNRFACYLEFEENRVKFSDFLSKHPELDYILVNRDTVNRNLRIDCLAFRNRTLTDQLPRFANLAWQGEFLDLYSLEADSSGADN